MKNGTIDYVQVENLQMLRLLIDSFERGEAGAECLLEDFEPEEAEKLRQCVLRLKAVAAAYERDFQDPYTLPYFKDISEPRRHLQSW